MSKVRNHVLVNGSKIGNAIVVSDSLLKKGSCIPGTTINPTSVTFHQTACIDVDALQMKKALNNANNDPKAGTSASNYRQASWTITVGHEKIIQNIPLNWKAYAQGSSGNKTSISIEMCMYTDKNKQYQTYLNAIALFKVLKSDYKFSLVPKAHYDWTKKNCPQWLLENRYGYSWPWFKGELNKKDTQISKPSETPTNTRGKYIVRYLQQVLNSCYNARLEVDGSFGPATKSAVKKHYLKQGYKGDHVIWLQKALTNRGYKIEADGLFGPATLNAVKQYQKSRGLEEDGFAGLNTHTKIVTD